MKRTTWGISFLCIIRAFAGDYGSLMTTAEEGERLAQSPQVKEAVIQSSQDYEKNLILYRQGTLPYDSLEIAYASTFAALLNTIKSLIAQDPTGMLSPIQNDYDTAHAAEYEDHLKHLIGMTQKELQ